VPPILHFNFRGVEQMTEKTLRYAKGSEGDLDLLKPTGLLRELMRSTIFSGSWGDGYAGTAVTTSAVVGRWYGALLAAERRDLLAADLPPVERRRLKTMRGVHAVLRRWRDGLKRLRGTHDEAGPRPADRRAR
jgi:hypothetical protein